MNSGVTGEDIWESLMSERVLVRESLVSDSVRFIFTGRLRPDDFTEFACHRAARLNLGIDIESASDVTVSLTVAGTTELIDAFEMACSLGPYDCLVLDVMRHDCELAA